MTTRYTCRRGEDRCGVLHRSVEAAVKCIRRDAMGNRIIVALEDGAERDLTEAETLVQADLMVRLIHAEDAKAGFHYDLEHELACNRGEEKP